jgi:hypothetical protein
MQSREKDSAAVSAFPCDGRTSDHTSSGLSLVFPLVLLLCASVALFGWSLEAYDAFIHLPVLFQWQIIVACSLFALGFAATVREFRSDWHERWAARVVGAAGVAFLVAFSFRISVQVDRLQNQIVAQTKAKTVSEQHGAAVYQVTLKSGQVIELDALNARSSTVRSLPHLAGRRRTGCLALGAGHGVDTKQHASIDPMPFRQSWHWAATKPTGASTNAATAGHSPDF